MNRTETRKQGLLALLLVTLGAAAAAAPAVDLSPVPRQALASPLKPGWQHGAVMEIFVRGYQDSDGDGIGDLPGLTARLDYLQQLGVSGLWLMPITASADRDHGYATTDFRAIEPQYGRLADFDTLIREAHRRGIAIIIDYVINHAARSHPLFEAAAADPQSPWRDWFVWQQRAPQGWDIWGKNPWYAAGDAHYFGTFGPHMPDFNMRNPAVVAYHESSLRWWLNRGLDGFRLDAVPHLIENSARNWNDQPESRALTARFARLIRSFPGRHAVCEATAEPQAYARPEVCGSAFAFGLERRIIAAARGEPQAPALVAAFYQNAPPTMATMLANHDIFAGRRVWDQLQGDERAYKLAAASYLLGPGMPFIYYGEEIGMAGVESLPGDEPLRGPMSWSADLGGFTRAAQAYRPLAPNAASHNAAAQARDPGSILNFYKAMLKLRRELPSIARGRLAAARVEGQVLSLERRHGRERSLVLINYGRDVQALDLPLRPGSHLLPAYPVQSAAVRADTRGLVNLLLPAQSVSVYRLSPP